MRNSARDSGHLDSLPVYVKDQKTFDEQLRRGLDTEWKVLRYLQAHKGMSLSKLETIAPGNTQGPRIHTPHGDVISPDLLAFTNGRASLIEVKDKSGFWYLKIRHQWLTGIDRSKYDAYCLAEDTLKIPIDLYFYQRGQNLSTFRTRTDSPSGLYYLPLSVMRILAADGKIFQGNLNKTGPMMINWDKDDLVKVCDLEDIR